MVDWKRNALVVVVLLWAGILLGVSFLATPAKFGAPSLSLAVAVDVGRSTFAVLNRVELGSAVLAVGLLIGGASREVWVWLASGSAVLGLLLETLWLLPILDERAQVVQERLFTWQQISLGHADIGEDEEVVEFEGHLPINRKVRPSSVTSRLLDHSVSHQQ